MSFYRQSYLALILVGIYCLTGCRSGVTKSGPDNCEFICFQDVGSKELAKGPFTICIDDPTAELKDCIAKHLGSESTLGVVEPQYGLQDISKITPEDFLKIAAPVSHFISNVRGRVPWEGDWGNVRVTIFYGAKVQSKDIGREDYERLIEQIPAEVLQRNPGVHSSLGYMESGPPPDSERLLRK